MTDEDDTSAMMTEDDKSTRAGEDATADIPEEVVGSSRPEGNPTGPRLSIVDLEGPSDPDDPNDPDDPSSKYQFPSATNPLMRFTDDHRAHCNPDGTRKKRATITLPNSVQFHLCQWMCSNHYLHGLQPGKCRTTLESFKQQYNLHDCRKDERARRYFGSEVDECAHRFSKQIKKDGGVHRQRRVVEFKAGYEYLQHIDHLKWDGTLTRMTLEASWIQRIGFLQTGEIEALRARCTEVLNDRNPPVEASAIDPSLVSSSEKPKSTTPPTSKVSPSKSMPCERGP